MILSTLDCFDEQMLFKSIWAEWANIDTSLEK